MIDRQANIGKIPPQAVDLEQIVLGLIMTYKEAMPICAEYLIPDSFYNEANKTIYSICLELFQEQSNIDMLLVTSKLKYKSKLEEVGGHYYIASLTNTEISAQFNLTSYCLILSDLYKRRKLIEITAIINNNLYDGNIETSTIIDSLGLDLIHINDNKSHFFHKIGDLINSQIEVISKICGGEIISTGVLSGIKTLDWKTCGWQKSDLIILAGRPSMGKTAIALQFALAPAQANIPTVVFSQEMSGMQLANRYISKETGLTQMELRRGQVQEYHWKQLENVVTNYIDFPLYINDLSGMSVMQVRAALIQYKQKYNIQLAIIDYLQLLSGTKQYREQEISEISRTLKITAKELDIPIIALSQLNRAVESRPNKRPNLSDLRESGAIEQDADMVIFIHRPEKYGILEDDEGNSMIGKTILMVEKFRNGSLGDVVIGNNESLTNFYDLDQLPITPSSANNSFNPNRNFETSKDEYIF